MPLPDRIRVTGVSERGFCLTNIDALMRLRELGYSRKSSGIILRPMSGRSQLDFLSGFEPTICSIDEYRRLVGDERSNGPMHKYQAGMTVLMEKAEDKATGNSYYMIIDTGIGAREIFLEELQRINSIRIEPLE